jgi:hypothetical protein
MEEKYCMKMQVQFDYLRHSLLFFLSVIFNIHVS